MPKEHPTGEPKRSSPAVRIHSEAGIRFSAGISGWLTRHQADVLAAHASAVPAGGTVIEIGSHQGRSTVVLGSSVPEGARVVAIDPFPGAWRYGSADTEGKLR